MAFPVIIPILAALLSAGANIYSSRKQDKYNRDVEWYNQEEEKKRHKEQRRAAIQRSIGSNLYNPSFRKAPAPPKTPNTTGASILSGIGNVGSSLYSNLGSRQNE